MATKRQLKKLIRNSCGAIAAEILLARAAFPAIERKDVVAVINDAAALQQVSLEKVSISFDKCPSDYDSKADYNKARREYFRAAYGKLLEEFEAGVAEIVKKMNAALPADVRSQIAKAVAE